MTPSWSVTRTPADGKEKEIKDSRAKVDHVLLGNGRNKTIEGSQFGKKKVAKKRNGLGYLVSSQDAANANHDEIFEQSGPNVSI